MYRQLISDVVEAQPGWPPDDVFPEESRLSGVDLAPTWWHTNKRKWRVESGLGGSRSSEIPPRSSP